MLGGWRLVRLTHPPIAGQHSPSPGASAPGDSSDSVTFLVIWRRGLFTTTTSLPVWRREGYGGPENACFRPGGIDRRSYLRSTTHAPSNGEPPLVLLPVLCRLLHLGKKCNNFDRHEDRQIPRIRALVSTPPSFCFLMRLSCAGDF